jgi:hypothetical protein
VNRYERRREKALRRKYGAGDTLHIDYGRVVYVDPTVVDQCFLCGGPAKAWPWLDGPEGAPAMTHSFARINNEITLPLCEACFNSKERGNQVARKVMRSPDMVIQEGGEASPEHVREIADTLKERERSSKH